MKKLLFTLFTIFQMTYSSFGFNGELYFQIVNSSTQKFRLDVTTSQYAWTWDKANNDVVFLSDYSFTTGDTWVGSVFFDAPNNFDSAPQVIPWGLMHFSLTSKDDNQYTVSFTLDLRDKNWSAWGNYPSSADAHVLLDANTRMMYLSKDGVISGDDIYINGSTQNIWDFWNISNYSRGDFKVPIKLFNKIENTEISFGHLNANGHQVFSGSDEPFKYNKVQTVTQGTLEKYTDVRNYSFKWSNSDRITPVSAQIFYNSSFNFSTTIEKFSKSITRNFRPVYPLTIKNNLIESNLSSVGEVLFKDPTTDNQFQSYSAAGSGFVKDNAFNQLDIEVNGQLHQKYSVKAISPFTYNGRNYYWQSGDFNHTTQTDLLITGATTKTANYKGLQLSNQTNAIAGNGQKKLIKTSDGHLHQTYESLNKVWYERSTDNGVTWEIMNGGAPVSVGNAKQPSIDFYNTATDKVVVIVYEAYSSSSVNLMAAIYKDGVSQQSYGLALYTGMTQEDVDALNCRPVVSISSDGKILIVWYADGELAPGAYTGLNYKYGNLYNYYGIQWMINWYTPSPVLMSSTSYFTLKNPTLSVYKPAVQPFQLAYEKDNVIYYRTLTDNVNHQNHIQEGNVQNISSGSGFSFNNNPSILAWSGGSRVVWEVNNSGYKKRVIFRSPSTSYFWSFNNSDGEYDCLNPNINHPDNYSTYYFSWSENNDGIINNNSLSYAGIRSLGIDGQFIQLSNGATPGAMYATTLNSASMPFYFTQSASLGSFYGLLKVNELFTGSEGRRGVVSKDSAEFYFNFGKITVDDNNIGYVKIDESKDTLDEKTINQYLISQPFNLGDNSSFTFNIQYGVTDTVFANAVLGDDDYVSFKLQLVDNQTSVVIGEYDKVKFSKTNLSDHNNLDYLVNTKGIGNRSVILKLIAATNFEANYALTLENSGKSDKSLNKKSYKEVLFNNSLEVTDYVLDQNFPNPFNPSTTIRYQIPASPKSSPKERTFVTLKIYDILGNEIATLVNEEKAEGRYEVNFDASSLASGVYVYRIAIQSDEIRAGSFTASKKLMLIK